jgi:hypothetical protein
MSHQKDVHSLFFLVVGDMHKESTSLDENYGKALQAEDPIKECRDHLRGCVCLFHN